MTNETSRTVPFQGRRASIKFALIYGCFGGLWILFSDMILPAVIENTSVLRHLQTCTELFFVLLTAMLICWLIHRSVAALEDLRVALQKTNRIQQIFSKCNHTLVHADDESTLMKNVCRNIVDVGGYPLAWIGFAEYNREKRVRPVAHWGFEDGYLEMLNLTWAESERGYGPTGRAIRNGVPSVFQNICTNPDYELWREEALKRGYASVVALPLKEEGKPFGALSICAAEPDGFDEVELKLFEDLADDLAYGIIALRMKNERLQLRRALLQSQKIEAIGTVAGGITHEFNNILGTILTCSEIALDELPSSHPVHEDLEHILKAGLRGKKMVKQILSFGRSDEKEVSVIRLNTIIKDCLNMLRAILPSTIEIRQHLPDDAGSILADPTQVHQIVLNLCTNAAHAIDGNMGLLEVNLEPAVIDSETTAGAFDLPSGSYVKLSVEDNGHGMTPDVQERIFEPFFTTRKNKGGSGLGLPVVYALVTHNRGAITVESTPGIGTVFHVFFPRVDQDETIVGPPLDAEVKGGTEHILLVDDDPDLRYSVKKMLNALGYRIQTAATGVEALEVFNRDPGRFDIIITDQTMPEMKGTELAEKILAMRPGTPIILCSGYQIDIKAHESEMGTGNSGIRFFLRKPITCVEIAGAIRAALENDVKPTSQEY